MPDGEKHPGPSTGSSFRNHQKTSNESFPYNSDDYYALLGIPRTASMAEVRKAYKRQAFLHHPDKSKDPDGAKRFAKISTAFEVLSNPTKRSVYDAYGVEGLRRSNTTHAGDKDEYQNGYAAGDDFFSSYQHNEGGTNVVYKDPPVYHDLYVTLEEISEGSKRRLKITRKMFSTDNSSKLEEKLVVIQIKPGWKAGTKIIFEREGDRRPGILPADIIFVLRDKPHPVFKRNGSDVIYTASITLKSALLGGKLMIPLLNKQRKLLKWTDVINPRSEKRLKGVGLPKSSADNAPRGDLIVLFDITFPKALSEEEKLRVNGAIPPYNALLFEDL